MIAVVGVFDDSSSVGGNVQWRQCRTTTRQREDADPKIKLR